MDENKALAEDIGRLQDEMSYRGKAYQQLITDKDGKAQWEDQLAYDGRIEISWDGDTTGRVSVTDADKRIYYKISDLTPTKEEIIGGVVKFGSNHDPVVITQNKIHDLGEELYATGANGEIIVSFVDNFEVYDGTIIPERGTYVWYDEITGYAKSLTYGKIKQLDEKFLPIPPNFNVTFNYFKDTGSYTCNVTYSQLRDCFNRELPIFAICEVRGYGNRYETLIISSYESHDSSTMYFNCSSGKSGTLNFAYHEDGTIGSQEPS